MLKLFKYIFIVNLYKKAKKNLIMAGVMLILMFISTFLMNDLIEVARGSEKYLFLLTKWVLILVFLAVIAINLLKVFNIAIASIGVKPTYKLSLASTDKKQRLLGKEHLETKSESIIKKYMQENRCDTLS